MDEYRLYRCFNDSGELLYIGITSSPKTRESFHARYTRWWPDVANVEYERIPGAVAYRAAAAVERDAIQAEDPRYNLHGRRSYRGAA